jgi:hypothetical protein
VIVIAQYYSLFLFSSAYSLTKMAAAVINRVNFFRNLQQSLTQILKKRGLVALANLLSRMFIPFFV